MKKLMWVLFLISMMSAMYANSQAAIATTDFVTGLTMLLPDGVTPVPDGSLFQIMLPGVDGIIDPANPDGTPGGDDQLVTGVPGNNYYEFPMDTSWTGMPGQLYTPTAFSWPTAGLGTEPCANEGDQIYLRLFDAPAVGGATNYLDSELYLLPIGNIDVLMNTMAYWDNGTIFNWQPLGGGPIPDLDWGDGVTGTLSAGTGVAGGSGYGSGLPNEELLQCVLDGFAGNVGYWFTLTIDDALLPVDLEVCLLDLAIEPFNLAYWYLGEWVYYPEDPYTPIDWMGGDCVTFTVDAPSARADVDIPIVFSIEDGSLPVTLASFSAAVFANEFVEISWTTESEQGNTGWYIYRSLTNDLTQATQINDVLIPPSETPMETSEYSYVDEFVDNNTTYWYWLESIGTSETTIHGPSTLTVQYEEDPIVIIPETTELLGNYPNPFNPVTEIKFNVKAGETAELTIFDIKGRVVENATYGTGVQSHTWEANSSASGVYFYKLQSESLTSVKKMMLLK